MEIQPPATLGKTGRIAALILFGALLVMPFIAGEFTTVLLTDILVFTLFAASLHFMMGNAGLVSFGHAAFFGLGAYGAAILVGSFEVSMAVALVGAPLLGGLGAAVVGWFAIRLSGVYLAMLTLAAAQILWSAAVQWQTVTGGDDGILGIWPAAWASGTTAFYYMTLALTVASVSALMMLGAGPTGLLLRAARDQPLRAAALGIDVKHRQWAAIVIAGTGAGLAGGLYAFSKGSVFPDTLAISNSVDALMMVLMGGLHAPAGPIIGAGVFTLLEDQLSRLAYWRALLGAAIVGIALFAPGGLGGALSGLFGRKRRVKS